MNPCRIIFLVISLTFCGLVSCNTRENDGNRQNTGNKDPSEAPFWGARGKRERNGLSGLIRYELVRPPTLGPADGDGEDAAVEDSVGDSLNWAVTSFAAPFDQQLQVQQSGSSGLGEKAEQIMHPWSYKTKRAAFLPAYVGENKGSGESIRGGEMLPPWLLKGAVEQPNPIIKSINRSPRRKVTLSEYFSALIGLAAAAEKEKKNSDKDSGRSVPSSLNGNSRGGDISFWAGRG